MKVAVSGQQRFWFFELARQLFLRQCLQVLYTGYPASKVSEVARNCVRSHWLATTASLLVSRRTSPTISHPLNTFAMDEFDRWVAGQLTPCDVVVAGSTWSPRTLKQARALGAVAVCDRGSTHILAQRDILQQEYERYGVPFNLRGSPMIARLIDRELQAYEEADYIAVPSTVVVRSFTERGVSPDKMIRLPYGVDLSDYRPLPKRDDVFRVLFVGHAGLRKGIQYLLEATSSLQLNKFEVVLVGGIASDAQAVVERYGGRFRSLGFVPRLELADVYSQGSVLVLPSVEEGLALVQAQAMACGLPVIATVATGAEDLFTHGEEGFIVPQRDPVALREAILTLYDNPDMQRAMSNRALARVRAIGGWDAYGTAAVAAYQRILAQSRGPVSNA